MADARHRTDNGPARTQGTLLIGAILASLLTAGCATIPSSGPVESTPIPAPQGGGGGATVIVEPPQRGWTPEQVVSGFLLASSSFTHHHAVARQYLTPAASRLWQPGSEVTIPARTPTFSTLSPKLTGKTSQATVAVRWQELATLNSSGQYQAAPLPGPIRHQAFTLVQVHGQWRISGLPTGSGKVSHELLLPSVLFRLNYAPRNLYFYGQPGQPDQILVPDPVFVPVQSRDLVTTLVKGLLHDPGGWLENAAVTAFPPGTRLRKVQVLPGPPAGKTAIVDIGLPPGVPKPTVEAMAAQLVWTLTSSAYSPALIQTVKLKINGSPWAAQGGDAVQSLAEYGRYVPHARKNANVYYVSATGPVKVFGKGPHSAAVHGQAGTSQVELNKIAVSMDEHYLAGVAGPATTVYTEDLAAAAKPHAPAAAESLHSRLVGADFSAPSWDSGGNLWVTGKVGGSRGIWVMPAGAKGRPVKVSVSLPGGSGPVTALKVAPDGVRIAMIVGRGAQAHLVIGGIVRSGTGIFITLPVPLAPGLPGPTSLTWYDENHLLAITQRGGTRLWEVPVNGDEAAVTPAPPGMASITAAGSQNLLYVGMA
ncbi:MAG: LpqB family beta-propeller domain-containing protein, partial [Streptosporangiaceae bacterium]